MAIVSNLNVLVPSVATNGIANCFYYLKETLKSAGWKVLSSSNGTTLTGYSGGTTGEDSISSVTIMNNTSAWFRITDPASVREFVFMRGGALTAIIKYSRQTKFTGGSPNATTLPTTGTGGDGVALCGSSVVDASVTTTAHATQCLATAATARFNFIADTEPINGVYPWYEFAHSSISNTNLSFLSHEAILSGSCSPLDNDQSWFLLAALSSGTDSLVNFDGTGATFTAPNSGFTAAPGRAWYKYGLTGASFERAIGLVYAGLSSTSAQTFPANIGTNPYDSKDNGMPILIRGVSYPKGLSSGIKWKGTGKTFPEVIEDDSGNEFIHVGNLLVPWPTGSVASTSA